MQRKGRYCTMLRSVSGKKASGIEAPESKRTIHSFTIFKPQVDSVYKQIVATIISILKLITSAIITETTKKSKFSPSAILPFVSMFIIIKVGKKQLAFSMTPILHGFPNLPLIKMECPMHKIKFTVV